MASSMCFFRKPLPWILILVPFIVCASISGYGLLSILFTTLVLILSSFFFKFSKQKPLLVEKSMEDEALSSDQKCLQPVLVKKSMEDEALSSDRKCLQPVLVEKSMEDEALSSVQECLQPMLVEKSMEAEAISSDQKCLQPVLVEKSMEAEALSSDQACFASKLEFERENITEKKEAHESGVDQVYDYIVRSPDSFSESESIDHSSTSEGSEVEWPYSGDVAESPDCSDDDSISDEESLIEIALPSGHYSGPEEEEEEEEEPESNLQNNFSDFSPESLFREGSLMELSPEGNEMNEEENLIEIDISMGSIKCSRFEIEA